ncbi:hypothetical protein [Fluviicola taffensis]|uniref:Uncharacterized protein n=1 Tax=Fluviicola taffensis (strain DSM 16823 / NCIMB 13979 / RW262) TaxID=755732 RepID=F2IK85_FLUTR|nr:hypothetical protein [Fluviicola taffensis]AEA43988.1 hypothetical protein Fluta_2002 [Fluviicola taffensis DSM 16823]
MSSDLNLYIHFNFALENATKEVTIQIAELDFKALKQGGYKLCFAKNVNEEFDVVWQCYSDYLSTNVFSWTPQFQLFGTNAFIPQQVIKTITNVENCSLGNTCVLNEAGFLEKQKSGGNVGALTMENQYGFIHGGLKQLSTGISGQMLSSPVYVSKLNQLKGEILLTPKDILCVWFQQSIQVGMMISKKPSNSISLDLTSEQSLTCLYENQEWKLI